MAEFKEFKIKLGEHSKTYIYLFMRQHRVREFSSEKPTDKTLFVAGVPCFINEESIHSLFSVFGKIAAVYIHKSPSAKIPEKNTYFNQAAVTSKGFKVAYVVFENSKAVDCALMKDQEGILKPSTITSGMKRWSIEYNNRIPNTEILQNNIDEFMSNYDNDEKLQDKKLKEATEADDEGWITVTKKSRKPGFARKESVLKHISNKITKKKKRTELSNFYRFQIKESKMKNLVSLRQKFEDDKKRIAALKATRRFKPF